MNEDPVNCFLTLFNEKYCKRNDVMLHQSSMLRAIMSSKQGCQHNVFEIIRAAKLIAMKMLRNEQRTMLHHFPMCKDSHWWLMVVDTKGKKVHSLDSHNSSRANEAKCLLALFRVVLMLMATKRCTRLTAHTTMPTMMNWHHIKFPIPKPSLQQSDNGNSGMHCCSHVIELLKDEGNEMLNGNDVFSNTSITHGQEHTW